MPKNKSYRLEKQIYCEERCGSFRIKVFIDSLHKDSATFSTVEVGLPWARRRRVELLEGKAAGIKQASPEFSQALAVHPSLAFLYKAPAAIKLSDVFDSYEKHDLPKLTGKASEKSRLVRLRKWFGERTVDQLDESLIDKWKADRLLGKLGSGRDPNRAATLSALKTEEPLTKQQRHARKKAGKDVPALPIYPISLAPSGELCNPNCWRLPPGFFRNEQTHSLTMVALQAAADELSVACSRVASEMMDSRNCASCIRWYCDEKYSIVVNAPNAIAIPF